MLKAHQACIDLQKDVLRIQGREVHFLAEHELPDKARIFEASDGQPDSASAAGPSSAGAGPQPPSQFPGAGNTLGAPPAAAGAGRGGAGAGHAQGGSVGFPEEAIRTLMSLGATRELAISSLEAAGGNLVVV